MSILDRQVATARSRLHLNLFFDRLCSLLLIAAAVWAIVVLVERLFVVGLPVWLTGAALGGLGLLAAMAATAVRRIPPVQAALVIDEAAGLKERLSSAVALRGSGDEFAQAAIQDAEKAAAQVHVPTHIPRKLPRALPASIGAVCLAMGLAWLLPAFNLLKADEEQPEPTEGLAVVEAERRQIESALEEQRKRIQELAQNNPALKDLELNLEPLDITDKPEVTPEDIRKEAVKQLNNAAEQLAMQRDQDQREVLESMKRMLSQLETPQGDDAASRLADALKTGDFQAAKEEMSDIQKQLEEAAQRTEDQQAAAQMQQMQQKLAQLSEQMNKTADTMQIQKELEKKAGMTAEEARNLIEQLKNLDPKEAAKQVQQQLAKQGIDQKQIEELAKKIQQNQQAQQQMQQLAQSLAQAAQQMAQQQSQQGQGQQGQGQSSSGQAMSAAMDQLSQMELSEQLMNEMEAQLSELNNLKDNILNGQQGNCPGCGQSGCQGNCNGEGQQGGQYGRGYGATIGKERVPFQYKPSKADTRIQGGQIIAQMMIDGPQMKGEATAEAREAVVSAIRDAEDAVERGVVPRQYHNVTRRYFEALAGLSRPQQSPSPQQP